jgi:hypothetical protein
MNFLQFPLNHKEAGVAVEVTLSGVESDVFLVDDSNLASFRSGGRYTYFGGHYKSSPVLLKVPHSGNWTVVVVPIGGRVEVSVRAA